MAEQTYGDWIRSNPKAPTKKYKTKHMDERDYKAMNDELKREHHIGDTNEMITAVEWLFSQIPFEWSSCRAAYEALAIAKQMEKHQHGNTWDAAIKAHDERGHVHARSLVDFDEWYEEQFKK